MALIVLVHEGRCHDSRRRRRHEGLSESGAEGFEASRIGTDRRWIDVSNVGNGRRRIGEFRRVRKTRRSQFRIAGKLDLVSRRRTLRLSTEAAHAAWHIGLKCYAALLTVVTNVDAGRHLLGDPIRDRNVDLSGKSDTVDCFTGFLANQKVCQALVARQAADMCEKDPISTGYHGSLSAWFRCRRSGANALNRHPAELGQAQSTRVPFKVVRPEPHFNPPGSPAARDPRDRSANGPYRAGLPFP